MAKPILSCMVFPFKNFQSRCETPRFGAVPPAMSSWALGGLPVARVLWLPPASVGRGSTAAAPGPERAAVELTIWASGWKYGLIGFNGDLTNQNEVCMGFNET